MRLDLLKQLAGEAREVEEAIRPLNPDVGEKGYVSGEIWVTANGLADDLESAYLDALSETLRPPCKSFPGCRVAPMPTQKRLPSGEFEYGSSGPCRFDPKTGLCGGRMP